MRKLTIFVSTIILLTGLSANTLATMKIIGPTDALPPYDEHNPSFTAQIYDASYAYIDGKPTLFVQLFKAPNINIDVEFTGADLAFGMAAASSVDKNMTIYFANADHDIDQINIEHNFQPTNQNVLAARHYTSKK